MIHKIKLLYDNGNGCSIHNIVEELGIARNTVRKYLRMSEDEIADYFQNQQRKKALDQYKDYIIHLLQKYPKLSAVKIMRKLKSRSINLAASTRTLRRYVKQLKKDNTVKQQRYYEPVIDMVPGVQCQVDPGELRNVPIGGRFITVYFVVFVLSYSRLMYVSVSDRPVNTEMFIRMHNEAFSYFDGVPQECVYDQTKLVVIKEEFREVWFNETFHQYAAAVDYDLRVCEGYDPESKGKVESGVKYVKNNFFYGEHFHSFTSLKNELLEWINTIATVRIHGTTKEQPGQMYKDREHTYMKPYLQPKDQFQVPGIRRKVDKTSLISYKSNKYSVPLPYQCAQVLVKEQDARLIVYSADSGNVLAKHVICGEKGKIIKNNNHYRDYQKQVPDHEKEICQMVGDELGTAICKLLKTTSPKIYKDQLVGLITVLKSYTSENDLTDILNCLIKRPRLTVTFIRDYLQAHTHSERKSKSKNTDRTASLRQSCNENLRVYGNLSMRNASRQQEVTTRAH